MTTFTDDDIQWLLDLLDEQQLGQIEVEEGEDSIAVRAPGFGQPQLIAAGQDMQMAQMPAISAQTPTEEVLPDHLKSVESPVAGVFYGAASPDADPYVQVGDVIEVGDTIGIVEAMKLYHDVTTPIRGVVTRILVQNAEHVDAEQPLIIVDRNG